MNCWFNAASLRSRLDACGVSAMARINKSMNQRRLYWYMGSRFASSATQKYSIDE